MFETLLQAGISGLAIGAMYALVAFGFSITFATTKTMNFAQGDFVSIGAFIGIGALLLMQGKPSESTMIADASVPQQLIALTAAVVLMGLIGVLMYRLAVLPFADKPGMSWVMSTLGFGVIMTSAGLAIWGPASKVVPPPFGDEVIRIFGAGVRSQEILMFVTSVVIMLAFDWVMRGTGAGRAMRAVAFNQQVASLMGINVKAYMFGAFFISSALAGIAGVLIAPVASASLYFGFSVGLKGFSSAIVGGLNNPRGCVAGGFMLGLIESLSGLWWSSWSEVIVFALVIVVLGLKPSGLFGSNMMEKV